MLAVNELDPKDNAKKLRKIAQAVVDAAIAGDMQAAKEIGDRLDGKPSQSVDVGITDHRNADELSDAELAALALEGRERSAKTQASPKVTH